MKSASTLALLLFTALATAAFVWMAKRPAVDYAALSFGMPTSGMTSNDATTSTSANAEVNTAAEPTLNKQQPAAPSMPDAPVAEVMEKPVEPAMPSAMPNKAASPEEIEAPKAPEAPTQEAPTQTIETQAEASSADTTTNTVTTNTEVKTETDPGTTNTSPSPTTTEVAPAAVEAMKEKGSEAIDTAKQKMETIQMTVPAGMEEAIQKAIENAINSANSDLQNIKK